MSELAGTRTIPPNSPVVDLRPAESANSPQGEEIYTQYIRRQNNFSLVNVGLFETQISYTGRNLESSYCRGVPVFLQCESLDDVRDEQSYRNVFQSGHKQAVLCRYEHIPYPFPNLDFIALRKLISSARALG